MRVSFVGLVFIFGFAMIQALLRGVGEVLSPMLIVLGTVILNFLLDPLFIFGWGPLPAAGVAGAAFATLGTQSLAALIGMALLASGKYGIHVHLRDFRPDVAFMKRAFTLGLPASIEQSTRALGMTVMTFLMASFGTVTVAAFGMGINVLSFVIIPAMGLSMATSALVGQNIGAGQIARADSIARLSAMVAFVSLSVLGAVVFVGATPLMAFFVPTDEAVVTSAATFLRTVAPTFGFVGLQMALTGVFRAAGNMVVAMTLALVSQWVIQFPLAYILSMHTSLGASGLWWAFPVSNVIVGFASLAWFLKGDWKKARLTDDDLVTAAVSEEILLEEGVH
jgi:putative MATE family efflux protein